MNDFLVSNNDKFLKALLTESLSLSDWITVSDAALIIDWEKFVKEVLKKDATNVRCKDAFNILCRNFREIPLEIAKVADEMKPFKENFLFKFEIDISSFFKNAHDDNLKKIASSAENALNILKEIGQECSEKLKEDLANTFTFFSDKENLKNICQRMHLSIPASAYFFSSAVKHEHEEVSNFLHKDYYYNRNCVVFPNYVEAIKLRQAGFKELWSAFKRSGESDNFSAAVRIFFSSQNYLRQQKLFLDLGETYCGKRSYYRQIMRETVRHIEISFSIYPIRLLKTFSSVRKVSYDLNHALWSFDHQKPVKGLNKIRTELNEIEKNLDTINETIRIAHFNDIDEKIEKTCSSRVNLVNQFLNDFFRCTPFVFLLTSGLIETYEDNHGRFGFCLGPEVFFLALAEKTTNIKPFKFFGKPVDDEDDKDEKLNPGTKEFSASNTRIDRVWDFYM